jgi:hypothetical protein
MMNEAEKNRAVESIRRIQTGGASEKDLQTLEHATGNPDIWILFDALELEGFRPESILDLLVSPQQVRVN